MHELEAQTEISSHFFVYYMYRMPLDQVLPKLVVSVIPHERGKANAHSNAHHTKVAMISVGASSSCICEEFLRPICESIFSDEGRKRAFGWIEVSRGPVNPDSSLPICESIFFDIVSDLLPIGRNDRFVFHTLECVQNKRERCPIPRRHCPEVVDQFLHTRAILGWGLWHVYGKQLSHEREIWL
jgi:hypothetical protein